MADDVLSMLPSQVQRRHANDWTNYEAMLPRPSHSKAGLHDECVRTTVPFVRTILRASAHEKTTTSARQNNHDKFLASPRKPSWRSAHEERDVLKREWKAKHSVLSEEELAEAEALEDKEKRRRPASYQNDRRQSAERRDLASPIRPARWYPRDRLSASQAPQYATKRHLWAATRRRTRTSRSRAGRAHQA
ncbi:hypothetical protein PPROV_000079800 [Pycnococcus provasolii]|uniref:Uncharacterized protein n=1 Tax=Pycnococcus provasolii TaxID=41880 RepID=A0A830H674_9CHLO|nr:hypothetical protein PPROV_000079800 [Pycnococcus provasolii]